MERDDGITAADLVKVIKACKEANVARLNMYGVNIEFNHPEPEKTVEQELPTYEQPIMDVLQVPEEVDRYFMEAQMLTDDPLALEEMVMQGDNEA